VTKANANHNTSVTRLLIAVWGNPWYAFDLEEHKKKYSWVPVSYAYRGVSDTNKKWRTTIPFLLEVLKPTRTLIYVPESVIYKPFSNYEELKDYIDKIYKEFLEKECGISINEKINISVLPSVGKYKNNISDQKYLHVEIRGSPLNYAYMLALNTAEAIETLLSKHFKSPEETLEVYLEVSHGVNFMPILARVILQELLNIVAMFINVKLVVLNSEPVPKEETGTSSILEIESYDNLIPLQPSFTGLKTLNLLVEQESGKQEVTTIQGSLLTPLEEIKDDKMKESIIEKGNRVLLDVIPREKLSDLLAFAAAYQHMLPLWIFYFKNQLRDIESKKPISSLKVKLETLFNEFTKVESKNNTISITHFANIGSVTLEVVKAILALHTLSAAGYEGYEKITLEELKMKKLRDMPGTSRYLKLRIEHDIGIVARRIADVCRSEKSSYIVNRNVALIEIEALRDLSKNQIQDIEKQVRSRCENIKNEVESVIRKTSKGITNFARNLVAHSGLEHCTVVAIIDQCLKDESEVKRRINVTPKDDKVEYVRKILKLELL